MAQCKTKTSWTVNMEDKENLNQENLINLKRLKDGYTSIVDKMGYGKFKPYLQRLFHSIEIMLEHEETEYKKIDAKYQDMVRQCHIYEKTLSMLKENNTCEMTSFSESSNTYAFDDLTKVTPYLAPDLLQSTLGATNGGGGGGGSTSIQFRLPCRRSSLTNRQYVSTPLGPIRTSKPAVPLAHFDDDSSFGFQQQKQFTDASTDPIFIPKIEQKDFSCQMIPISIDQQIETIPSMTTYHSTQTDIISTETIACQINPNLNDCSIQTTMNEYKDFSCQFMPISIDQITETISKEFHTQIIQTDFISTNDYSCQITPNTLDQQTETIPIESENIGLQSSFIQPTYDDQQIQTDLFISIDVQTQYEYDTITLPIVFSEELPITQEIEINETIVFDQECQTINDYRIQSTQTAIINFEDCACQSSIIIYENESTQTALINLKDSASQSSIITYENQTIQTEFYSNNYSSSLFIIPHSLDQSNYSSKIVILPREDQTIFNNDQAIQCKLDVPEMNISIPIETITNYNDRRSLIQYQLDEKEKQMNRIIEEYATLYGEYESERRRNLDLIEARDRLADHIKILSDELGDREINQEKLLIKSCQQTKLINYMLPRIDCSPTPRKKHHSASSFRRLLPKFK